MNINIDLKKVVGKGYKKFWNFKGRYRVIKGSRASKKSKTAVLWYIVNLMIYSGANLLVIRKTYRTLKDSCFTELKWAINRLNVSDLWEVKESPLEMTFRPTGQRIYFRGLDDPLKVTSITVEQGSLSWIWIEEAYEILNEPDFDTLDESIRGTVENGLFKQITLTFNPWNEHHWIKHRFFDEITGHDSEGNPTYTPRVEPISADGDILAITTNYLCNEWLDEADKRVFERMKENNPRRYQVAGLGEWGIVDGLVYENWKEEAFVLIRKDEYNKLSEKPLNPVFYENIKNGFGLDFGYTNDPSAAFIGFINLTDKIIYVYDEMYEKGLSNKRIWTNIQQMGYSKDHFTADCAEPKSIDELSDFGMKVKAAKKGNDSVNNGIQWIQDCKIIIHPRCVNFLTEISNYTWKKDKFGKKLNESVDDFNHLMDAMRYGLEQFIINKKWLY